MTRQLKEGHLASAPRPDSYGQIFKTSVVMGGAAGANMLLGFIRTKFAAVLLGPVGIGALANFTAIQVLVGTIAGLGLQNSAVRDISQASATESDDTVGRVLLSLRRLCWVTGLAGLLSMMALSPWLSRWTFGSKGMELQIAALGGAVLLGVLSGGQLAQLQGMRRIGDLAKVNVIGALFTTAASVLFYSWLGFDGIVPTLLAAAAVNLIASRAFAKRLAAPTVQMSWTETFWKARGMLSLGLSIMWAAMTTSVVGYVINVLITSKFGIASVGIYSAAFTLSAVLVNSVLSAMGSDYYPRLAAVAHDHGALNRLVNEQTEIGLLLAAPCMLSTLTFAPWVVRVFYSADFLPAVGLLQWFVLGCLIRVIQWPMGYLQQALGKGRLFVATQTSLNCLYLALTVLFLYKFGIEGAAAAFFVLYAVAVIVIKGIAFRLTRFTWTAATLRLMIAETSSVIALFIAERWLALWPATLVGMAVTAITTIFSLRGLASRIGPEHRLIGLISRMPPFRLLFGLRA